MSATESNGWTIYAEPIRGRSCGECKACCTQVPAQLDDETKPANVRCRHVCSKGCAIYPTRPDPCRYWSCKWLFDPMTGDLRRPDRSGYIIDPALDTVLKDGQPVEIIQVWVDPNRRAAHRDPALRAYLVAVAEQFGLAAIVRFSSTDGLVLVAPSLSGTGDWLEIDQAPISEAAMQAKLAEVGASRPFGRHARY